MATSSEKSSLGERARKVVEAAAELEKSGGRFDSDQFIEHLKSALAQNDLAAAEKVISTGEARIAELSQPTVRPPAAPNEPPGTLGKVAIERIRQWVGRHEVAFDLVIIGLIALAEAVVLIWIQVQAYLAFSVYSLDVSAYNQALYVASSHGLELYYTINLPGGNQGNLLAVHFSPLLYTLVPFFAAAPGVPALLTLKQVLLGLGALPTYALARRRLGSRAWGWLFALTYLVTPVMTGVDWVSFDPEIFLPLTILCAIYFFEARRFLWFIVSLIASLEAIETSAVLLGLFAGVATVAALYAYRKQKGVATRQTVKFSIAALVVCVVSFAFSLGVLFFVFNSAGSFSSSYGQNFQVLGATSIADIPIRALLHPLVAVSALEFQGSTKFLWLVLLFGCFAFLPLLGELKYLVPAAGWVGLALLSNNQIYYAFGNHYLAYPLPFLVAGSVSGVYRLRTFWPAVVRRLGRLGTSAPPSPVRTRRYGLAVGAILAVAVVATASLASPFLPSPIANLAGKPHGLMLPDAHDAMLEKIIGLIPSSASVLTTSRLFADVSDRVHAYVEPNHEPFTFNWSLVGKLNSSVWAFKQVTQWYLNLSTYVLLDFQIDKIQALYVEYFGNNLSGYGVRAAADGIYLYERGWKNAPQILDLQSFILPAANSTPAYPSVILRNQSSSYGSVLYRPVGNRSVVFSGPQVWGLPPGQYEATFWWTIHPNASGHQVNASLINVPISFTPWPFFNTTTQSHYMINTNRLKGELLTYSLGPSWSEAEYGPTVGNYSLNFTSNGLSYIYPVAGTLTNTTSLSFFAVTLQQTAVPEML